jgi:beta-glucanase (GH16 family)
MKKALFLISLTLTYNLVAQSPYKLGCNYGGTYLQPQQKADCNGWMNKEKIDQKHCLPNQPWRLVFEDEFNGTQLDRSKWKSYGQCAGDVYNQEANLAFTGSSVKMMFKQQNITGYCTDNNTYQNFNYTSGAIQTHSKFRHGFFEIRCKLPAGIGVNPSFWLYGDCAQEADVFELLTKNSINHGENIHSDTHKRLDCSGTKPKCKFGYTYYSDDSYTDGNFHIFGFEWDAYKYEFYIDGCKTRSDYCAYKWKLDDGFFNPNLGYLGPVKNCGDLDKKNDKYWVHKGFPTHTMTVILTLQKLQDDASNSYQEFEIDYVRIWQKQNCDEDIKICDFNDYSRSHDHINTYTHHDPVIARSITFECGSSGSCNYQMDLIYGHESRRAYFATERIDILPGFDTGLAPGYGGSDAISPRFDAGIRPCPVAVSGKMEEEEYFTGNENQEYEADELADITESELNGRPETLSKNTDLEVYPNPATNEVYIRIPDTQGKNFTLQLTDIQMKTIKILETGSVQYQQVYTLQDIPSGMYFVQFISSSHKITKKLIKL